MKRAVLSVVVASVSLLGGALAVAALRTDRGDVPQQGAATPFEGS